MKQQNRVNLIVTLLVRLQNQKHSLMTNPEKAQLIHPPIRIMGRTLVRFPFIMSVIILVSEKTNRADRKIFWADDTTAVD